MRYDRILSLFAIMILLISGLSVIAHPASGEKIKVKQNKKDEKGLENRSEKDKFSDELESKSSDTSKQEDCEEKEEPTNTVDHDQNREERQNFGIERITENNGILDGTDNERSMITSKSKTEENEELLDNSSDNELIMDTYEINFQENMTALTVDANFSISRIEINSTIYTAEEIRNAENSDMLIENISSNMTDVFVETISSAFPDAKKDFHETSTEEGISGPIEVSTFADIYLTKKSLGFEKENDQLNMSEVLKETMDMGANLSKDVALNVKPGHNSTYRFEVPVPYRLESDDTWGVWGGDNHTWDDEEDGVSTWIFNNSAGDKEVVLQRELRIKDQNTEDIAEQEEISVDGIFELQNLGRIDITLNNSISIVNIKDYDDFTIPELVENLKYVDANFIRTAVKNGLGEWKTITDEMNSSIDEVENKMPSFLGDLEFNYTDPGREKGAIVRKYKVENSQPNITMDDEEIDIDNEITESLMKSGGVVNFQFSSLDEEYYHYSIILNFRTPDFMTLYNSSGEMPQGDEDYDYKVDFDPKEGFNGEFRSNQEVPDDQSINLDMNIDIQNVNLKTDYSAIADAKVDGRVEAEVVEAPEDIQTSLPEEIDLKYATADLIRQLEKRDVFDKERVFNMTRKGENIDNFDGMNQTIRDALGKEDIGVSTRFQEGTWQTEDSDTDTRGIVLLIRSKFDLPLMGSTDQNALDIYSVDIGEFKIPSIEGVDTNFKITFPSGIRSSVEETENVKTGETPDSRNYIAVSTSGNSEEEITIDPDVIITLGILFSGEVYLNGISLMILTIIIIIVLSLLVLGVGMKIVSYKDRKKKKLIKYGMEDALKEENDPDRWLAHIPEEKKDKYDIDQDMMLELELQKELQDMRKKARKEEGPISDEEMQQLEETEGPLEEVEEDSSPVEEEKEVTERSEDEDKIDEETSGEKEIGG